MSSAGPMSSAVHYLTHEQRGSLEGMAAFAGSFTSAAGHVNHREGAPSHHGGVDTRTQRDVALGEGMRARHEARSRSTSPSSKALRAECEADSLMREASKAAREAERYQQAPRTDASAKPPAVAAAEPVPLDQAEAALTAPAPVPVPETDRTRVEARDGEVDDAGVASAIAALATKKAALAARRQELANRSTRNVQQASEGANVSANRDEPLQAPLVAPSDADQLLAHLVEEVKIKPASASAYVEVLIAQDFDVELFHELTAQELRDEFAFVGGDIKRVERYRKASHAGPPAKQPAPPAVQVSIPETDRTRMEAASVPETDRTRVEARDGEVDDAGVDSAIAALATKKAALAARRQELANRSTRNVQQASRALPQPEPEPAIEVELKSELKPESEQEPEQEQPQATGSTVWPAKVLVMEIAARAPNGGGAVGAYEILQRARRATAAGVARTAAEDGRPRGTLARLQDASAITIQKHWRGIEGRSRVSEQLQMELLALQIEAEVEAEGDTTDDTDDALGQIDAGDAKVSRTDSEVSFSQMEAKVEAEVAAEIVEKQQAEMMVVAAAAESAEAIGAESDQDEIDAGGAKVSRTDSEVLFSHMEAKVEAEVAAEIMGKQQVEVMVLAAAAESAEAIGAESDQDENEDGTYLTVIVPDGFNAGDELRLEIDDGKQFVVMIPEGLAAGDEFEVEEPDWAATLEQEAAERQRQSAAPIEQIPNLPVPVLTEQDSGGQGADIEDVQPQNLPAIGEMELMAGWSEHVSESTGKTYYYNGSTGESTFTKPGRSAFPGDGSSSTPASHGVSDDTGKDEVEDKLAANGSNGPRGDGSDGIDGASPSLMPEGWSVAVSRSTGEQYFVNTLTQTTTYDRPAMSALDTVLAELPNGWNARVSRSSGQLFYIRADGSTTYTSPFDSSS